jgi:hypothetical protein
MNLLWITGWAIPKNCFYQWVIKTFPHCNHTVINPTSDAGRVLGDTHKWDLIIGHSLGAYLLLLQLQSQTELLNRSILLSPFLDFKKESMKGGSVSITQLRYLNRWLKIDSIAAIRDFYNRAGLKLQISTTLPYVLEELLWGIDLLINTSADTISIHPQAFIGRLDLLIDSKKLKAYWPHLQIVTNATHDWRNFSSILQNQLQHSTECL